jgi:hypothetical protein
MFCDLETEEGYPDCVEENYCGNLRRFYCVLWSIFNLNFRHLNKQTRLDKFFDGKGVKKRYAAVTDIEPVPFKDANASERVDEILYGEDDE